MESIIVALISGGLALIGVIFTNSQSNKKIEHQLETHQAVTDTKIEELTREVREHNNFAQRVPVLEEHMKRVDARLDKLERKN
mgnify:CR=1 FL=1